MAKINVNKIEAARRQIDTAIRLFFSNGDPVSIHTLAAAGFRILRDIAQAKGTDMHKSVMAGIRPGMEGEFWKAMNRPANFLKHADIDPDEILSNVEETINDFLLVLCCAYYTGLGYQETREMKVLQTWILAIYPDLLLADEQVVSRLRGLGEDIRNKDRAGRLETGNQWLEFADRGQLLWG